MNYITTNIRLPEELYMELKLEAARRRSSVSALIREQLQVKNARRSEKEAKKLIKDMDRLARRISKQNKGLNLSQAIIDMRYEQ